jgi:murein L,D-transpeptidase YafK
MKRVASLLLSATVLAVGALLVMGQAGGTAQRPRLDPDVRADRILIEKKAHAMTLFSGGHPLRRYAVALGRGGLEPKAREGDDKTPEGLYRIDARNARSAFHLALHISYPEARDTERAAARAENPGSDIMIHGIRNGLGWLGSLHRRLDWTAGCVAVTDPEIEEIWRVVPIGTPVEIRP